MRTYIAGCAGMLGESVYKEFAEEGPVYATDLRPLDKWCGQTDVRRYAHVNGDILSFKPDIIINLAALTDLEYCEFHEQDTMDTNATPHLAAIAMKHKIPYVYTSTAGIFDGKQARPYNEFDQPVPLSIYGKGKYFGEVIAESLDQHLILRPGWMMGGGPSKDKKFINKVYKQLKAGAEVIHAVTDKAGTPTYTVDLAKTMRAMVSAQQWGLFNCTCAGATTRFEVAKEFISLLGLDGKVLVAPARSYMFPDYAAPRPATEVLDCSLLQAMTANRMRGWKESLADYAKAFPTL